MRIEAAKQLAQELPITTKVLSTLRATPRLFSTYYLTMNEGRQQANFDGLDRKLEQARERRALARAAARKNAASHSSKAASSSYTNCDATQDRALLGSNSSAVALPLINLAAESI